MFTPWDGIRTFAAIQKMNLRPVMLAEIFQHPDKQLLRVLDKSQNLVAPLAEQTAIRSRVMGVVYGKTLGFLFTFSGINLTTNSAHAALNN
jgi:hypothetical protein